MKECLSKFEGTFVTLMRDFGVLSPAKCCLVASIASLPSCLADTITKTAILLSWPPATPSLALRREESVIIMPGDVDYEFY